MSSTPTSAWTGILEGLRRRSMDVTTAAHQATLGASDATQLATTIALGRVFLTEDHDFLVLAEAHVRSGRSHPGVLFIRPATSVGDAIRRIAQIASTMSVAEMVDRIQWI
ncbi:MAG TPA: DUF5615 family PIN-like protein [Polyangiaceae bacterium]|nr:DUF5615 family PIN-like protein [Polyangiaceae bacterium]